MAQSFLNRTGLALGLRNNNPGNLRPLPGGQKWQGEIERDSVNNFSRFQDVGYGLRAMITDITGDIVNKKQNTLRKLIMAYAPPGDNNNTAAYISRVASATGLNPDQLIPVNQATIEKIVRAKLSVELGPTDAARLLPGDYQEGFAKLASHVKAWLGSAGGANTGGLALVAGLLLAALLMGRDFAGK